MIEQMEPTRIEIVDETKNGLTKEEAETIRNAARTKPIFWSNERCCYWIFDFQSAGYWCAALFFGNGLEEREGIDQFEPLRVRVTD